MKIGVISDTHLSKPTESLYKLTETLFEDVSMVLHAGDLTRISILDAFRGKEVIAVCGNMDHDDVTRKLPEREIITVKGHRIGLIHGWGSPRKLEDKIMNAFVNVDVIVYGHTHKAANHIKNGVLMFNPGAFSGTLFMGRHRSVGVL